MAFFLMMRSGLQLVFVWFGAIMILVVLGLAATLSFTDYLDERLYGNKRILFIAVLIAYAVYRAFRLKNALSARKDEA